MSLPLSTIKRKSGILSAMPNPEQPILPGPVDAALAEKYILAAGELIAGSLELQGRVLTDSSSPGVLYDADILSKAGLTAENSLPSGVVSRAGIINENFALPSSFASNDHIKDQLGENYIGVGELVNFFEDFKNKGYFVRRMAIDANPCTIADVYFARVNREVLVYLPRNATTHTDTVDLNMNSLTVIFPEYFPRFPYTSEKFITDLETEQPKGPLFISKLPLPGTVGAKNERRIKAVQELEKYAKLVKASRKLIRLPTATEVVLSALIYHRNYGEFPFTAAVVETSTRLDNGNVVYVTCNPKKGFVFEDLPPGKVHPKAGFYSSR